MYEKVLATINMEDTEDLQKYEDLLRKRLRKLGYQLSKRKFSGFKITEKITGDIVAGKSFDLSIAEAEAFWKEKFAPLYAEKQEKMLQKRLKKLNAIQISGGQIVTNDNRAIRALEDHITRYGNFDAEGHEAGGGIASVIYRAYRPYACPEFSRVWPVDGDWHNLTDLNLRSDADEATLSDGVIPINTQRRIWHDEYRIFIKLPGHDQVFFTEWDFNLFEILSNRNVLSGWYVQRQDRKSKIVYRLYCRIGGGTIISLAEIVVLYDAGKIDRNSVVDSLQDGKKWLRDNHLQVDHLRDNTSNNCRHNLTIMPGGRNTGKSDAVTDICLPYGFVPVRIGETFRIVCGKFAGSGQYSRFISCHGWKQFLECLDEFKKITKSSGEMLQRSDDPETTNCISQMLWDDGREYHDGRYNVIEGLLTATDDAFTPWTGDVSVLYPGEEAT